MTKIFKKNKILIPMSAIVLMILSIAVQGIIINILPENILSSEKSLTIVSILVKSLFAVIIAFITLKLYKIKIEFGKNNLVKGIFWYGIVLCIACVFNIIGSYQKPEISLLQALPMLILFLVDCIGVGFYEEILYRGLIFNSLKKYFGENKKGIYASVILSALVFGGYHLANLFVHPDLVISTISQFIYASFVGVLFAVIYYRSKNILPCIILHTIFDFASYIWICFSKNIDQMMNTVNTTDSDIVSALVIIGLCSTFLISGLCQLRKVFKNKEVNSIKDKK